VHQKIRTTVADVSPLGQHYGDWELVVLRVDHATEKLIGVYLTQHGKGEWFEHNQISSLERLGDRIIVYPSRNGHANYPHVGENPTERTTVLPREGPGFEFYLKNDTDHDTGPHPKILDCSQYFEIVSFYDELEPSWINYKGRWGPQNTILNLDYDFVENVLKGIFGEFVSSLLPKFFFKPVIDGILSQIKVGDEDGPIGPKGHDDWRRFNYNAP